MTVHITFTGPQAGMTLLQQKEVRRLLTVITDGDLVAHHGDCIGADDEFHSLAWYHGTRIVIHPSNISGKRAFANMRLPSSTVIIHEPKPPLVRNHDMVDVSSVVIATPAGEEVMRSGTWATIRYARKTKTRTFIVTPDGNSYEDRV
jgi:hypothetical protein